MDAINTSFRPATLEEVIEKTAALLTAQEYRQGRQGTIEAEDLTSDNRAYLETAPYATYRAAAMLYAHENLKMETDEILSVFRGNAQKNIDLLQRAERAVEKGSMKFLQVYANAYRALCREMQTEPALKSIPNTIHDPEKDITKVAVDTESPPPAPKTSDASVPQSDQREKELEDTLTLPQAPSSEQDLVPRAQTGENIMQVVIDIYNRTALGKSSPLTIEKLESKSRNIPAVSLARGIAMHTEKMLLGSSFHKIGERYGGRTKAAVHTTIRNTQMRLKKNMKATVNFQNTVAQALGCNDAQHAALLMEESNRQPQLHLSAHNDPIITPGIIIDKLAVIWSRMTDHDVPTSRTFLTNPTDDHGLKAAQDIACHAIHIFAKPAQGSRRKAADISVHFALCTPEDVTQSIERVEKRLQSGERLTLRLLNELGRELNLPGEKRGGLFQPSGPQ